MFPPSKGSRWVLQNNIDALSMVHIAECNIKSKIIPINHPLSFFSSTNHDLDFFYFEELFRQIIFHKQLIKLQKHNKHFLMNF